MFTIGQPPSRLLVCLLVLVSISGLVAAPAGAAQDITSWPTTPPAPICGDTSLLSGPATPPPGAIVVPAGLNTGMNWNQPGATFWFAPGVHTFGDSLYGQIIPGDSTTFVGAPGAILDGQHRNLYAFTQHARGVTIRYLEIRNFGTGTSNNDEGVINHDSGENWTIEYNYVHDNDGAGVFIGSGSTIRYNCLKDNGQYGFSSYHPDGVRNVVFDHNEVTGNNQDDWESIRDGCGCTGGGKFWDTHGAVVTNNWVHDNRGTGLWADHNNADFLFEGNYIEGNDGVGLFYEVSYNFLIQHNTFVQNALVDGRARAGRGDPFPTGAIYISESGGDARAGSRYAQSAIAGNYFENNWDGVVLWENADRFCRPGEPFDTTNGCPFFDRTWGTRYKTQNITVQNNAFHVNREAIGCANALCARMAVFSNYGSHPANSPYLGTVVQQAITFDQNNRWLNNAYHGPWRFTPFDMGRNISFDTWRGSPYTQDAGSTFDGDQGPPSTPPPPPPGPPPGEGASDNFLNADTATLEGSTGAWTAWYASAVSQSTEAAHGGTRSLKVEVTEPFGWGVQLANYPGFAATAGSKRLSIWARLGSGAVQPTVSISWLDASRQVLETDDVVLAALTDAWTNTSALLEAPRGTRTMLVFLRGTGSPGTSMYFDDIVIGDVQNAIDADTSGLEATIGQWEAWYSSTVSRSAIDAHSGTYSLLVAVADSGGWGVQIGSWPGFAATPGAKRIGFWGRAGTGSVGAITLRVKWFDEAGRSIQTDLVPLNGLTAEWRRAVADVIAPPGTTDVRVEVYGSTGAVGDTVYIDSVVVTNIENLVDADTASLEGSLGHWAPWYAASIARSTAHVRSGVHSLLVQVTAPWGWGVQLANWPGYAVSAGPKRITYSARRGAGRVASVTLRVKWLDVGNQLLQTDLVTLNLTTGWQRAAGDVVAPAGAAHVWLELISPSGVAGDEVYVDAIMLAEGSR